MNDSMDAFSAKLRNAHTLCKDTDANGHRLSSADDVKKTCTDLFADVSADLENLRSKLVSLSCPNSEKQCKSLLQNMDDLKNAMNEELAKTK